MSEFNFNPNLIEFSFKNALALAEVSELAYKSKEEIEDVIKLEWGFSKVYYFDKNETQGFVAGKDDMILLAFRGTEQEKKIDILIDLLAWQKSTELGKIHYGFWTALNFVWKDILVAIKEFQDNNQPIWVTGHSLGGALASIAIARLAFEKKFKNIKGMYTYGKPRVGDKKFKAVFKELFKQGAYRVTNYKDPVSLIPLFNYKHTGEMVLLDDSGKRINQVNLLTRILLIVIPLIGIIVAFVRKIRKKETSEETSKWINKLITPHNLERYKSFIRINF